MRFNLFKFLSSLGLLFFLFFFVFNPSTLAFSENFSAPLNSSDWSVFNNDGSVDYAGNSVLLRSSQNSFPYVYYNDQVLPDDNTDFRLRIKFRYNNDPVWGTGICVGNLLPSNNMSVNMMTDNNAKICLLKVWRDASGLKIQYNKCATDDNCRVFNTIYQDNNNQSIVGVNYLLEASRVNGYYQVDLTNLDTSSLVLDYNSSETNKSPQYLWFGNPMFQNGYSHVWAFLEIDDIEVNPLASSQTIIIPGLGGSWNTEAIVLGESRPQTEWSRSPFVDIYDNLITSLTNAGAAPLVFYYDWRQSVGQSASDLNDFINSHVDAGVKVDLVGHSLGGLVARSYQQSYGGNRVNKLITLGSSHKGVVQAYEALAGGKITDRLSWDSVAKRLLLEARGSLYRTNADVIRQEISSLKDITPIFNFAKLGRRTLASGSMNFANQWLGNLNSNFADYQDNVDFIVGQNSSSNTPEWLILRSRSLVDRLLGLWPDGSLRRTMFGPGDGAVLSKSAFLGQDNYQFNLPHRQLPSSGESIGKVMELLDINGEVYVGQSPLPRDDTLVFMIGSPADLQITAPGGQVFDADSNGFVIIPHPAPGEYLAVLTGTSNGRYHLITGKLASQADYWNYYQGLTAPGQVDEYRFNIDFSHPSSPMLTTTGQLLEECVRDNRLLEQEISDQRILNSRQNLENALVQFDTGNYEAENQSILQALTAVFSFRRANLSDIRLKTTDLVDCQTEALVLSDGDVNTSRSSGSRALRKARRRRSLVNRIYRLKNRRHRAIPVLSAKSYHDGGQLVKEARSSYRAGSYPQTKAFSDVAYLFFKESLR